MNDKVLARAREMQKVLREVEPKVKGKLKRDVGATLKAAERDIPKTNRVGKQIKFDQQTVMQAVEKCDGSKLKAAKLLKCSLRTVYGVLARDNHKPSKRKPKPEVNADAVMRTLSGMVELAGKALPVLTGKLRSLVSDALRKCERDMPSQKQPTFTTEQVKETVRKCGGDKVAAAKRLGCSLRTIYAALDRE